MSGGTSVLSNQNSAATGNFEIDPRHLGDGPAFNSIQQRNGGAMS